MDKFIMFEANFAGTQIRPVSDIRKITVNDKGDGYDVYFGGWGSVWDKHLLSQEELQNTMDFETAVRKAQDLKKD